MNCRRLFSLLPAFLLGGSLAMAAPVNIKNPAFADADADGTPDAWKAYPAPGGDLRSITPDAAGGVKLTDKDPAGGVGLSQWISATPGKKYQFSLELTGAGGCFAYLIFAPSIPQKDGEIGKIKLLEQRVWVSSSPTGKTSVSATAPAGSQHALLWIYSPKDNKACELSIKNAKVEETEGAPGATSSAPAGGPPVKLPPGLIQVVDFETGDFSQARSLEGGKKEVVSSPDPVRLGKHAMKVSMTHDQVRSEMTGVRSEAYGEFKYGWSIYIPEGFDADSSFSIVTQWHDWGSGKEYAPDGGPPTTLYIAKGNWRFKLRFQDAGTDKTAKQEFSLEPVAADRGKWTDFVMEVNWQSPQTGGGYLRLYKNGKQVIDYAGPTWYDGKTDGPFFKMGIYKGAGSWKGEESRAVMYFDEFRMGGKSAALEDVDPAKQPAPKS